MHLIYLPSCISLQDNDDDESTEDYDDTPLDAAPSWESVHHQQVRGGSQGVSAGGSQGAREGATGGCGEGGREAHVSSPMLHVTCLMSHVSCLYVACHMSHVACLNE